MCVYIHTCMCAGLTSDAEQDQDQAAQGQREGGREEAAEDGPHCVLRSRVCAFSVCVCVCGCALLINGSSVTLPALLRTN